MDIMEAMANAEIECEYAACCSRTKYVCHRTTPESVDAVLKSIGAYSKYRAFWDTDSIWEKRSAVYINEMYDNGKSWD